MSTQSSSSYGGPGFASLLTLLFIGLRLGHVIDWSWWWVLSPTLIGVGLFIVVFVAVLIASDQ